MYLARDLRHDRPVARKLLLPESAARPGAEQFEREINVAARRQHPHILPVLDSGTAGERDAGVGQLWFTMPFVDGESLRDRLRRDGRLPLEDALRVTTTHISTASFTADGVIHCGWEGSPDPSDLLSAARRRHYAGRPRAALRLQG